MLGVKFSLRACGIAGDIANFVNVAITSWKGLAGQWEGFDIPGEKWVCKKEKTSSGRDAD